MAGRCNLGQVIDPSLYLSPEKGAGFREYALRALQYLSEYSYEELGDQLPSMDTEILETCNKAADSYPIQAPDKYRIVTSVVTCIKQRYLGNCSMNGCVDKELVGQLISELPVAERA